MNKLIVFFILGLSTACSSVQFKSNQQTKVSFELTEEEKKNDVSLFVTKPFYMWGLMPSAQVVEVDKVFMANGHQHVTNLEIKEVQQNKKAMWMIFTLGMYYPQSFELSAKVN